MIEELVNGFVSVLTVPTLLVAMGGGLVGGLMAAFVAPKRSLLSLSWYVVHTTLMLNSLFIMFWVGQIAYSLSEGDPLWGRAVARALLTVVYGVTVGVGVYLGLRWRLRKEKA